MFCRKCGKTIPDDSKFCPYCGESVDLVESKIVPAEQLEEKEHGYCSNCGEPLPPGKLTGMCNTCFEQIGYDPYTYGKCEKCDCPLAEEDKSVCKRCLDNDKKAASFYTPYPVKPKGYYSTTSKKHYGWLLPILVCIGSLVLFGVTGSLSTPTTGDNITSSDVAQESSAASAATTAPEAKPDLELLNDECTVDNISTHITGTVKNNTSKQFTYVQIQFSLYDKNDNQIGTALANMNGLEPGGVWKFNAIGLKSDTEKYKLLSLKAY